MSEDVIDHGQYTEFLSHLRCERCRDGNHKCIILESDQRCLICTGAGCECIFTRTVAIKGPKTAFRWAQLKNHDIIDTIAIDKNINGSILLPSHNRAEKSDVRSSTQPPLPVQQDGDANIQDQVVKSRSTLQAASYDGEVEIVRLLLDRGADVQARHPRNGTVLQAASYRGHEEIVRLLIERGADVNTQAGRYGTALQAASVSGCKEIVQMLLDKGADVNARYGPNGTALQAASFSGHNEIVRLLLDRGADVNAHHRNYGTALEVASSKGHKEIVRLLLDSGADVRVQSGQLSSTHQSASINGDKETMQVLFPSYTSKVRKQPVTHQEGGLDLLWRKAINYCRSIVAFQDAGRRHHGMQALQLRQPEKTSRLTASSVPGISAFNSFDEMVNQTCYRMDIAWDTPRNPLIGYSRQSMGQSMEPIAGFQVLDSSMKPLGGLRKKRYLSPSDRVHAKEVRRHGACWECRTKKRRCDHEGDINTTPGGSITIRGKALSHPPTIEPSPLHSSSTIRYTCTWCGRQFNRMTDWRRHEESQHAPHDQWECCMTESSLIINGSKNLCMFCHQPDPDKDHLFIRHKISSCLGKNRIFLRRDKLLHHIRTAHDALNPIDTEHLSAWKRPSETSIMWDCPYCGEINMSWNERFRHFAKHMESGIEMRMSDHGFSHGGVTSDIAIVKDLTGLVPADT